MQMLKSIFRDYFMGKVFLADMEMLFRPQPFSLDDPAQLCFDADSGKKTNLKFGVPNNLLRVWTTQQIT